MTEKFENPLDLPSLSDAEAKARVKAKVHPKVTEDSIVARIVDVSYILLDAPGDPFTPHGTVCIITLENGWVSTGFSAPADVRNYDAAVGKRYAYDNAFKPLWQLEGYLLRDKLWQDEFARKDSETLRVSDEVGEAAPQRRDYSKTTPDTPDDTILKAFGAGVGATPATAGIVGALAAVIGDEENPTPGVSEPSACAASGSAPYDAGASSASSYDTPAASCPPSSSLD